jgi:transcriptional regulator with XRE-family HTH domain
MRYIAGVASFGYTTDISASTLIKRARLSAGLTQADLAERLQTTQSAIARLEGRGANPRIATVARALEACDQELKLTTEPRAPNIDATLVARQLRITPAERLKAFERSYGDARVIALAGKRARGELG